MNKIGKMMRKRGINIGKILSDGTSNVHIDQVAKVLNN